MTPHRSFVSSPKAWSTVTTPELTQEQVLRILVEPLEAASSLFATDDQCIVGLSGLRRVAPPSVTRHRPGPPMAGLIRASRTAAASARSI